MADSRLIPLGVIATPHGIRGQVKIRSFTANPEDITAYGPLSGKTGRVFHISIEGGAKDAFIASIEGVVTREEAEALRNTELYVPRSALPKPKKNEYYHEDLRGLKLITPGGEPYGTIAFVHNFGAGDLIAVTLPSGEEELIAFNNTTFPEIDVEKGVATIVPPEVIKP